MWNPCIKKTHGSLTDSDFFLVGMKHSAKIKKKWEININLFGFYT